MVPTLSTVSYTWHLGFICYLKINALPPLSFDSSEKFPANVTTTLLIFFFFLFQVSFYPLMSLFKFFVKKSLFFLVNVFLCLSWEIVVYPRSNFDTYIFIIQLNIFSNLYYDFFFVTCIIWNCFLISR